MPFANLAYRALIASPSDLAEERDIATNAVNAWTALHAEAEATVLLSVRSETHSWPQTGIRPQEAINWQIGRKCDLLIGMFWTKIGTKTGGADSGTIEEIDLFVRAGKPALLYFSHRLVDPNMIDLRQQGKLKKFKDTTLNSSLVGSFRDGEELHRTLLRDLTNQMRAIIDKRQARAAGARRR